MKKLFGKLLPLILTGAAVAAAVLIGVVYFNFISKRIYEDSTNHLEELYVQRFYRKKLGPHGELGRLFCPGGRPGTG